MKYYLDPWTAGDSYVVAQGVDYAGVPLYCITAHTAGSTIDLTKFRLLYAEDAYTSEVRTQFYSPNIFAVEVVKISIPNSSNVKTEDGYLRYCTGGINMSVPEIINNALVYKTYTAQGDFMGFSTITEEFDIKVGKFEIYLSGLTPGLAQRFTGGAAGIDFEGSKVEISRLFLDYQTLELIQGKKFPLFTGVIYNAKIVESSVTCSINIECSTLWADFERRKGRQSNNESNWLYQGNTLDTCFSKTATAGQEQFKWGSK